MLKTLCVSHPIKEMGTKYTISREIGIIEKVHNIRNLLQLKHLLLLVIITKKSIIIVLSFLSL